MAQTRERVSIMMDIKMYRTLTLISFAKQYLMNDKKSSISGIVNMALTEYMNKHKDEVDEIMNEYKKRGWNV